MGDPNITIQVKSQGGTSYTLNDVATMTTLLQLKEMVAKQDSTLIPDSISFLYKGKKLEDDLAPVKEIGIPDNGTLFFVKKLDLDVPLEGPPEPKKLKITIKTNSGTKYEVEGLMEDSTIMDVKNKLCEQVQDLKLDQFKLIYKGKPMSDFNAKLDGLGVSDGATMFMVKSLDIKPDQRNATVEDQPRIVRPDPGMMRFRVPQGGVGRNVRVNPPNGGAPFMVRVPATARVGDTMQVRIPGTSPPPPPEVIGGNIPPPRNTAPVRPPAVPGTSLMQVVCPPNATPGSFIQINVPNRGRMRVKVPGNAVPGQPFYFRVAS